MIRWFTCALGTIAIVVVSGCGIMQKKKECLDEDGKVPEQCEDMRVVDESGQVSFVRGDFNMRTEPGAYNPETTMLEYRTPDGLNLCGGTLVSKPFRWVARDAEGKLRARRAVSSRSFARHNTFEPIADRDTTLHVLIARGSEAPSRWLFIPPSVIEPKGDAAVGKTDVNFYSLETDALYYLVRFATGGPATPCELYPAAEELTKFPDETEAPAQQEVR